MYTQNCQAPIEAMPKKIQEEQTERLQMRVSKSFLQTLDELRRIQPDLPPRAEAIRRAVELALAAAKRARHK